MKPRYVVHVQRVVRLRLVRCWLLGPYRWRWLAGLVAWGLYVNSDNVSQDGKAQGGVRTLGTATRTRDGRRRAWQHVRADREMYRAQAERQCQLHNQRGD